MPTETYNIEKFIVKCTKNTCINLTRYVCKKIVNSKNILKEIKVFYIYISHMCEVLSYTELCISPYFVCQNFHFIIYSRVYLVFACMCWMLCNMVSRNSKLCYCKVHLNNSQCNFHFQSRSFLLNRKCFLSRCWIKYRILSFNGNLF